MAQQNKVDEFQFDEQVSDNRIAPIKDEILSTGDAEERMILITEVLTDIQLVPDVGDYYTFIYNAKTKGLEYDQHPLIACTDLFAWGFRGLNFHWQKYRNYTWAELAGQLYVVQPDELDDLLAIPYAKFRLNN